MLGHRTSLYKFKKSEIIPSNNFDHNGMNLKIIKKGKIHKYMEIK